MTEQEAMIQGIKTHGKKVRGQASFIKHLQGKRLTQPCYWCIRKGLPGNEFWLNFRGLWLCKVCFAPSSFPPDDAMAVVYDTFTLEQHPTVSRDIK